MRLASILRDGRAVPALVGDRGVVAIEDLKPGLPADAMAFVDLEAWPDVVALARQAPDGVFLPKGDVVFTAPYRRPRKIWGIGLNYRDHAADLNESTPDQPASFIKADHTIIGPDEPIVIPRQSRRTTVEAELGIIIGRYCRDVSEDEAFDYVWGVTTILDQTAEDILQLNPRYLTRSKNFPTFFCFGPELVPMSLVRERFGSLEEIEVTTVVNGDRRRSNVVANMTHRPASLISFHSQMMPLFPGDIISTGTPGAIVVADGDFAEAVIPGIGRLGTGVKAEK
ncbi:fumarylacetoacetate hydrolase family protein [Thermopolyspora sp. NPDC052614]|uniref:fumarylacetoacetate hydrolase family protein n=1 Tax=Thermopolyspora sp. NPDC052614 TaxID=3155682 RepID=UPI00344864A0